MTLSQYYQNLLIVQYQDCPKAKATIKLLVDHLGSDNLYEQLQTAYDLQTAKGVQLDTIGFIVGVNRQDLNDSEYRILIKFKIIVNNISGTIKQIDEALFNTFHSSIIASNNKDMTLTYVIEKEYEHVVRLAYEEGLLPLPLGMDVNVILKVPNPLKIFGFKRWGLETNASGFSKQGILSEGVFLTKENILMEHLNV